MLIYRILINVVNLKYIIYLIYKLESYSHVIYLNNPRSMRDYRAIMHNKSTRVQTSLHTNVTRLAKENVFHSQKCSLNTETYQSFDIRIYQKKCFA